MTQPHTVTPIETKGKKTEAPPLESLGPQEETLAGKDRGFEEKQAGNRLPVENSGKKAASDPRGGAGTGETDGEERDQSDRVARQQHIIKEKV